MTKSKKLVACTCCRCGRIGKTAYPRPTFLCVRCFVEKDLGRPVTREDIRITLGGQEKVKKEWHS